MDYLTVGVALVVGLGSGVVGTIISTRHDRAEGERQRAYDARARLRERQIDAAITAKREAVFAAVAEFKGAAIELTRVEVA